jgi:CHASE3 domain sensor protein
MEINLKDLIDYGALGIITSVAVYMVYWMVKELQKNFDACNERVDKLLDSHTKFVSSVSDDIERLLNRVESLISYAERLIDEKERRR